MRHQGRNLNFQLNVFSTSTTGGGMEKQADKQKKTTSNQNSKGNKKEWGGLSCYSSGNSLDGCKAQCCVQTSMTLQLI